MHDATSLTQVQLLGLPLPTRRLYMAYADDLLRELALVRIGASRQLTDISPARLVELADLLATSYAAFMAAPSAQMVEAEASGRTTCDVTFVVPAGAGPFVAELGARLAEAEEYCRSGRHLLTLPPPAELSAYRQWIFGEFVAQLDGAAPRRFTRPANGEASTGGAARHWDGGRGQHRDAWATGTAVDHQDLDGPLTAHQLEPTPTAPRQARRYVVSRLAELGASESLQDDAALATSELVTNAVLHARTQIAVTVVVTSSSTVRISVSDCSHLPVLVRDHGATAATGRGLHLVRSVASGFGIDPLDAGEGPGKRVWFELREPSGSLADRRQPVGC
ncbi:MAG TPA: ATP-binding protein [Actinomycetales bacterium]